MSIWRLWLNTLHIDHLHCIVLLNYCVPCCLSPENCAYPLLFAFNSLGQIACKELKRTGSTCSGSLGHRGGCLPMTWYGNVVQFFLFSRLLSALQFMYNLKIVQDMLIYLLHSSICYQCTLLVQMKIKLGMNLISVDNVVPKSLCYAFSCIWMLTVYSY